MNQELRETISHGTKEYPYSQHRIHGVPYGFHFPVHWHEEMEWIYVRSGHLLVNAGGEDYDMTAGQVLIVNPRQLHRMQSDDMNVSYYTILFAMELISFQSSDLLEQTVFLPLRTGQQSLPNLVPDSVLTRENLDFLEQVIQINAEKPTMYQLETRVLLLRFLMEVLRHTQPVSTPEDNTGQLQRQMLEYVRIHYKQGVSLAELGARFHLSPKYVSRFFKEKFDLTICDYISHLRMSHAKGLLENTELSVTEVAEQSGYCSVSFFIRQFTRENGCSPGKWRRKRVGKG